MNDKQKARLAKEEVYIDGLFKEVDGGYNKLHESIFITHFLDYFNGTREITNDIKNQWVDIAGSLVLPVELLNNDGEIVALVPPLSNPKANKLMNQTSIAATLMDLKVASSISPNSIENVVRNGIANKVTDTRENENFKNQWSEFLNKYKVENSNIQKPIDVVDLDFEINDD